MFRILLNFFLSFTLVFNDYSLFKIIAYQPNTNSRYLYQRSGGPQCPNYVGLNEPENVLFLDADDNQWIVSNNFTMEHYEDDPCCDVIRGDSSRKLENTLDLKMCNTTTRGFEVVGTVSLKQDGDNCDIKFEEMLRESNPDEYVFMSKMSKHTGAPHGYQTFCEFAYSSKAKIKQTDHASQLTVYHKNCDEENKVDMDEICSMEKKDTKSETMIFGLIGFSFAVLLSLLICIACMKRRGIMCFKTENQKINVDQNPMYGNTTNEDYFAERYDTNVVDTNQYYEEEYEA